MREVFEKEHYYFLAEMDPVILHLLSLSTSPRLFHSEKESSNSILFTLRDEIVNQEEVAFGSDNLDTILNLLSYSKDEKILNLVICSITQRIDEFGGKRICSTYVIETCH